MYFKDGFVKLKNVQVHATQKCTILGHSILGKNQTITQNHVISQLKLMQTVDLTHRCLSKESFLSQESDTKILRVVA